MTRILLVAALTLTAASANAAVFAKYDGVDGESASPTRPDAAVVDGSDFLLWQH